MDLHLQTLLSLVPLVHRLDLYVGWFSLTRAGLLGRRPDLLTVVFDFDPLVSPTSTCPCHVPAPGCGPSEKLVVVDLKT